MSSVALSHYHEREIVRMILQSRFSRILLFGVSGGSAMVVEANPAEEQRTVETMMNEIEALVDVQSSSSGANESLLNSHDRSPIDKGLSEGNMDVVDAINAAVAQLELTVPKHIRRLKLIDKSSSRTYLNASPLAGKQMQEKPLSLPSARSGDGSDGN
ncbi:hypothetical protein SDJN03_03254, partial [Cucurbita argyrosperma subsp. sororia]